MTGEVLAQLCERYGLKGATLEPFGTGADCSWRISVGVDWFGYSPEEGLSRLRTICSQLRLTPAQQRFVDQTPREGWAWDVLSGSEVRMARRLIKRRVLVTGFRLGEGERIYRPGDAPAGVVAP